MTEEEKGENDLKGKIIISLIIAIIAVSGYLIHELYLVSGISAYYTIGTVTGIASDSGGLHCGFKYTIKGEIYDGYEDCKNPCNCPPEGTRFYVTFLPDDPDKNTMHFDKPVPDSIKTAPPEGWYALEGLIKK